MQEKASPIMRNTDPIVKKNPTRSKLPGMKRTASLIL